MDESITQQITIKRSDELNKQIHEGIGNLIEVFHSKKESGLDNHAIYNNFTIKLIKLINEFETNPNLLDHELSSYINTLSDALLQSYDFGYHLNIQKSIGEIIYTFAKIRSFKQISVYFSSDVYLINQLIEIESNVNNEFEKFVCLLWLSNLALIPFNLNNLHFNKQSLNEKLYKLSMNRLRDYSNGSKIQIITSILLSRLLTRNDNTTLLCQYVENLGKGDSNLSSLLTVNKILKRVHFNKSQIESLYNWVLEDILLSKFSNLHYLYAIKILSKLATSFINLSDFKSVSNIINNLINDLIVEIDHLDINLRYQLAKSLSLITEKLSKIAVNYQDQLIHFIISQLENIDSEFNISKLHTILLTMGYMSLKKIVPEKFHKPFLVLASRYLFFKLKRGNSVLGQQVRDSSCFVIWSMTRFIDYIDDLDHVFTNLLQVLVFDQELILKKCSIAILQELLGRFGNQIIRIEDDEARGSFIVKFMEIINELRLKNGFCFQLVDLLYDKIDLSFLTPLLIKQIIEGDVDDGHYLDKLLTQPPELEIIPKMPKNIPEIESQLLKVNKLNILYDLTDVPYEKIDKIVQTYDFEHMKLDTGLMKGYLIYLKNKQLSEYEWNNFLQIIKHVNFDFKELIKQVLQCQYEAPVSLLLNITSHNPLLSRILFSFHHFKNEEIYEIIKIMKESNIDSVVRSNLIESMSENASLSSKYIEHMYDLFDDYTITDQGDVGTRIRLSMINLIEKNNIMDDHIRLKLIRLSGELFDKIRNQTFKILTGESFTWTNLYKFKSKLDSSELSEFWKGVVFTLGSSVGNPKVIDEAFIQMLICQPPSKEDFKILINLLVLNSNSKREIKQIQMILQFILRLFECNYQFPKEVFTPLFTKCYNLHINTNNVTRINTVLQLFNHISVEDSSLKLKIYNRFIYIMKKFSNLKVKVNFAEMVFFDIIKHNDEMVKRYDQIDWSDLNQEDVDFVIESLELYKDKPT